MRSATRGQMRDSDWRLYDYITRRFLATVSECVLLQLYAFVFFPSLDKAYKLSLEYYMYSVAFKFFR